MTHSLLFTTATPNIADVSNVLHLNMVTTHEAYLARIWSDDANVAWLYCMRPGQ